MSTNAEPFPPALMEALIERAPFHMITEGHPTDMELASKCGQDKTDAEIEAWAKTLTVWDLYVLHRRTQLTADKAKHWARYHRIVHAWRKVSK